MANEGTAHESSPGPIGRVRLDDPPASATPEAGSPGVASESGWSLAGVGLALVLVLVMVGALVIILWAIFQAGA